MNAIRVKDVHKSFKVYYDKGQSFKEKILFKNRSRYENREVLKGISFEVKKGEAIGLIGQNGCGKSTLLKLMTKIIYPDKGTIEMKGRISSLIELGAGFHPDMSGRENIYTNASIFGLNRKEIDSRIKNIIAFSELEEFIENPVRTYSSGMYMRLAFAVAINVDADILLIDEILAVGDANFQAKCFNKLREIKSNGTTIVIVSHSLGQIEQICERSIWIENGKIKKEGLPRDVHPYYLDFMGQKNVENCTKCMDEKREQDNQDEKKTNQIIKNRWGNGEVKITNVMLLNNNNQECYNYKIGDNMKIKISYQAIKSVDNVVIGIGIFRNDGLECYGTTTHIDRISKFTLTTCGVIIFDILSNELISGKYMIDIAIVSVDGIKVYDYWKKVINFNMYSNVNDVGIVRLKHNWRFDDTSDKIECKTLTHVNKQETINNQEKECDEVDLNNKLFFNIINDKFFIKKLNNKLHNQISIYGLPDRVKISNTAQMVNTLFNTSSGNIYIGDYTFTGHNVSIITGTHYIHKHNEERMQAPTEGNDIKIGNGVWLCSNATILGPCTIGDNAVIAAGAVVIPNTIVPPNTVFGGIPAKKIKDIK